MKRFIFLFALVFFITGCSNSEVSWGYDQDNGPDNWANISDEYKTCAEGTMQSPIDIKTNDQVMGDDNLIVNYTDTQFVVEDTGHSLEFYDETKSNTITYNDTQYNLEQIHFHNQSENTIDGQHYPLEGHFVHSDEQGNNLVISVMFNIGAENSTIGDAFEQVTSTITLNPAELLPSEQDYYSFIGSLTTPPCTENVQWLVFSNPQQISQEQLTSYQQYYQDNNRDPQSLNDREVKYNNN